MLAPNDYRAETTSPDVEFGRLIVGCGTFGGFGGAAALIGKGLDDGAAFATLDEAVALGLTMPDTVESYAGGASEITMRRWFTKRDSAPTAPLRTTTKVAPPCSGLLTAGVMPHSCRPSSDLAIESSVC